MIDHEFQPSSDPHIADTCELCARHRDNHDTSAPSQQAVVVAPRPPQVTLDAIRQIVREELAKVLPEGCKH